MKKIVSCICTLVLFISLAPCGTPEKITPNAPYDGNYPQHEAYGKGIGAMPGRVVWTHDPASVKWDGSGYWWETEHYDEAVVLKMVNDSVYVGRDYLRAK